MTAMRNVRASYVPKGIKPSEAIAWVWAKMGFKSEMHEGA